MQLHYSELIEDSKIACCGLSQYSLCFKEILAEAVGIHGTTIVAAHLNVSEITIRRWKTKPPSFEMKCGVLYYLANLTHEQEKRKNLGQAIT